MTGHATAAFAGQQCISGSPPVGVDLNPDGTQLDWASAKSDLAFGIIKATQGTSYTSSGFAAAWAAMKSAGVIRGAYHFFDPTVSGVDQANYFLGVMGTIDAGDLPPTLDIECPTSNDEPDSDDCLGNGTSGDATGAQITQVMNDWISTIVAKTGRKPLIYSYGTYFSDDGVDTTGLQSYPLWIADYSGTGCFTVPSPWTSATFWQYGDSSTVPGFSGADEDYLMGTLAQLTAFAAGTGGSGTGTGSGSGVDVVPDAGGSLCTLPDGDEGECLETTVCDALGGTYAPTAGYCPGAADIQCCTGMPAKSKHDAGATSGKGSSSARSSGASSGGSTKASGTESRAGSGGGESSGHSGTTTSHGRVSAADGGADGGEPVEGSSGGCGVARGAGGDDGTRDAGLALLAVGLVMRKRRKG